MLGSLVFQGAVALEGSVDALRMQCLALWFRRGLWFRREASMHCVRNAWPLGFRGGYSFGGKR